MTVEFFIPGAPVPQSRPKFARRGNFVTAYDPKQCKDYKSWVRKCCVDFMDNFNKQMYTANIPLIFSLDISLQKPASAPKRKESWAVKKPDCDNILKGIQDALESILYERDQQIVEVHVRKYYSERPGVSVCVTRADHQF